MKKKITSIGCFMMLFGSVVFAKPSDSSSAVEAIAQAILNAFSFFAAAIALGVLIFIGIKYVMSSANEKANLKGKLPLYLIGLALIILCSTIAGAVADVAGNENEDDIIDKGFELAGLEVGVKKQPDVEPKDKETKKKSSKLNFNISEYGITGTVWMKNEAGEWEKVGYTTATGGYNITDQYIGKIKEGTELKISLSDSYNADRTRKLAGWEVNGEMVEGTNLFFTMDGETTINAIFKDIKVAENPIEVTTGQAYGRAEAKTSIPSTSKFATVMTTPEGAEVPNFNVSIQTAGGSAEDRIGVTGAEKSMDGYRSLESTDNGTQTNGWYLNQGDLLAGEDLVDGRYRVRITGNNAESVPTKDSVSIVQFDENGKTTEVKVDERYEVVNKNDSSTFYKLNEKGEREGTVTQKEFEDAMASNKNVLVFEDNMADFYGQLDFDNNNYVFNVDQTGDFNPEGNNNNTQTQQGNSNNQQTQQESNTTSTNNSSKLDSIMGKEGFNPARDGGTDVDDNGDGTYIVHDPNNYDKEYYVKPSEDGGWEVYDLEEEP